MFGLNVFVEPEPTGTIDATKQDKYNIHHRRNDAQLFVTEEHTDNNHRQTGALPPQIPYHYKIHHDSVTMHLNNLQNYNPTSAGITYFAEHETNKHIHHGGFHSHPANKTTPQHRDTTVPDKIDKWRKRSNIFESPAEHSHKLNVVKV